MKRFDIFALALLSAAFGLLSFAAQAQLRPGADYTELKAAQPVEAKGKIEVVEFFWYRCIHCYNLESLLEPWVKKLPADVQFKRIPAVLSEGWKVDAGYFYTFEALGILDKVHKPFFDAIHKDKLDIRSEAAMTEWLNKHGIDRKKFDETYKSFGVQAKVKRAEQLSAAYQLEGVPMLAVQGRYTITVDQGGSQPGMLANTEKLIDVVRKTPAKK